MKPSEMSNEELVEALRNVPIDRRELPTIDDWFSTLDVVHEATTRLRNSIPKPVVKNAYEEGWYDGAIAVSGERMTSLHDVLFAEYWAGSETRTALGIMEES